MSAEDPNEQTSSSHGSPFLHSGSEDASGDDLWSRYLDVVDKDDRASIERWQGSTSGLLTFTGIFAATVATFLSQSFAQLQPDTAAQAVFVGNQTVHLLALLVSANNLTPGLSDPDISSNPFDFQVPRSAIILNSLWFLSLVISLICTLLATLVQEWSRNFQRASQRRLSDKTVKEAAFNHIYQRMGVERFGLDGMTSVIVGLIHVSVVLFLIGLAIFLAPVHQVPAMVVIISSALAAAFYVVASAIPVFSHDCPYQTWLTPAFGRLSWLAFTMMFAPILLWEWAKRASQSKGNIKIELALIKGVGKYTYELFDPDVDYVYLKDLPDDLKTDSTILQWLGRRKTDWKSFLNGPRLAFIWERMSGYLLLDPKDNEAAIGALLDHLPHQIPEHDIKSVSAFLVHLRRRERFMKPLALRMRDVNSAVTAVGALKLLRALVVADSPDAAMYDYLGGHWKTMEDTIVEQFPKIVSQIALAHQYALCGIQKDATLGTQNDVPRGGDLSVLIEVTKLRWTMLKKRNEIFREAQRHVADGHDHENPMTLTPKYEERIKPLDDMLLRLEQVQSFRLLPLVQSGNKPSEPQGTHANEDMSAATGLFKSLSGPTGFEKNLSFGRDLAVWNALTLLAHLIWFETQTRHSDNGDMPGFANSTRTHNFSYLQNWKQKWIDNEPPTGSHDTPASAVFTYLCDQAIATLRLQAIEPESGGRVIEFTSSRKYAENDGRETIRELLNNLVQRVSYQPPALTPAIPGAAPSSRTEKVSEGLNILQKLGIFHTPMHHELPRTVVPQQVSLTVPRLEELGLDLVFQNSSVPTGAIQGTSRSSARAVSLEYTANGTSESTLRGVGRPSEDVTVHLPNVHVSLTTAELKKLGIDVTVQREPGKTATNENSPGPASHARTPRPSSSRLDNVHQQSGTTGESSSHEAGDANVGGTGEQGTERDNNFAAWFGRVLN